MENIIERCIILSTDGIIDENTIFEATLTYKRQHMAQDNNVLKNMGKKRKGLTIRS